MSAATGKSEVSPETIRSHFRETSPGMSRDRTQTYQLRKRSGRIDGPSIYETHTRARTHRSIKLCYLEDAD